MSARPLTRACRDAVTRADHAGCPNARECGCECHDETKRAGIMPECLAGNHRSCRAGSCRCACHSIQFEAPPAVPKAGGPVDLYGEQIEILRAYPGEWARLTSEPLKAPTAANRSGVLKKSFPGLEATTRRTLADKSVAHVYARWPKR